jgi:DNA-binding transcriptional MerR regulator
MITISELASFAGVTIRAVRHYHARGLLPEPERDASGYRRYDAQAAIDLIRIKTLAEAGVPLARVDELLHAGPAEFAAALRSIDHDLKAEIRRLQAHRERVTRLADSDVVGLPPSVVEYLDRLRELGISERGISVERESWILVAARLPDRVDEWIKNKYVGLEDDAFLDLYRRFDAAFDYPLDDPRLAEIADIMVGFVRSMPPQTEEDYVDPAMTEMLDNYMVGLSPAWTRIIELIHERGLVGWTNIREP